MFLRTLQQTPGSIRGAILVNVTLNAHKKRETRYCARHGVFYFTGDGMSGLISISGHEYMIHTNQGGYFQLVFLEEPEYWNSLYKKGDEKLDQWALSRTDLLLKAGL